MYERGSEREVGLRGEWTYGNVIDDEHESVGDDEAVESYGARVSELVADLDVISVDPSSGNDTESVVCSDVG